MLTTQWLSGMDKEALTDAYAVRFAVFCDEQKIDESIEIDEYDQSSIHVVIYDEEKPVATGRLVVLNDSFSIGRVAVLPEYRGKHIGDLVMRLLIRASVDMGATEQHIHAQTSVRGFYEKLGFKAYGEEYEEAGISHINMVHTGDTVPKCQKK